MNKQSNTFITVLCSCCVMLLLFIAWQEPIKPVVVEPVHNSYYETRDYQLQITDDYSKILIFDGKRYVGQLPMAWKNSLGKILLIDND